MNKQQLRPFLVGFTIGLLCALPLMYAVSNRTQETHAQVLWQYKGWEIKQIYGTTANAYPRAYLATKAGHYPLYSLSLSDLHRQIDEGEATK